MNDILMDRIAGALYGVAIGDALGAPLEFMSAEAIAEQHGRVTEMIGGGWLDVAPGETTDDTAMTMAVAMGIMENPEDPIPAIGERFIAWANSGPKDIGGTCQSAIWKAATENHRRPNELQWHNAAKETAIANNSRSGGNGALMRTVYPGLYYAERETAEDMALRIATMTHWDDKSTEACVLYTRVLHLITEAVIKGSSFNIYEQAEGTPYHATLTEHNAINGVNPTGYVVDSLKHAFHCFWFTERFDDAIIKAANLGGDADTIAAITGGLAGAHYGFCNIPDRWVAALSTADRRRLDAAVEAAVQNRRNE